MKKSLSLLTTLLLAPLATLIAAGPLQYNRDIRPLLSDNCFACHGPDKANRKAELRLDVREAALAPAESGDIAVVPGDVTKSTLIARIMTDDKDDLMPPPKSHKKLTTAQKDMLKRWIAEGARYEKHWAFMPVQMAKVPGAGDMPKVDAELLKWPRGPIDWFILQKLTERGLKPSPPAEPTTLARRIALDLTGLPPGAVDVDAFLRDGTKDKAVENLTARLFKSPHYGERMAVDWLDVARFADTQGYQNDRDQDMHPFRDWVIAAFNRNLRFDQFTIEQIAGDLLPEATLEQKIATGFHRNHRVNTEGGVIPAEYIAEYTADRVETTGAVWLGQTFNCTRCHDHKFDPFTQQDFYSMKAFYNNVGEQGDGGLDTIDKPSPDLEKSIAPLRLQIAAVEDKVAKQKIAAADLRAWADRLVKQRLAWEPFEISKLAVPAGKPAVASDSRGFDLAVVKRGTKPVVASVKVKAGTRITALRIECSAEADDVRVLVGRVQLQAPEQSEPLVLAAAVEGVSLKAVDVERTLQAEPAPKAAAKRKTAAKPAAQNTTLSPGANQPPEALVFELAQPFEAKGGDATLQVSILVNSSTKETDWRVLFTTAPVDQLVPETVLESAGKTPAARSRGEQAALRKEFQLLRPESKEPRARLAALNNRIAELRKKQDTVIVMNEGKPKDTFILMRGEYDNPGEKVAAATPAVLPPLPKDAPLNRLGLARWLVSPENPLTARVTVNRLWQSIFGTGLVRTSEDFGAQGEAPSHPELLDWLAGEFMRSGWDVQHLLRLILTSATYQQTSRTTPELLAADPDNRLLARGPRFRLNAEFVRDQAIAAAGLLSEKVGGPSVRPYHPSGIYELMTVGQSTKGWVADTGENLHRRSLYTFWKRTVPHPAMIAFDAPGREICAVRRTRSNTPLQALNLMNDPTYIEAARHLAVRMLGSSANVADQIQSGYRTLLARDARPAELAVLTRAYERARSEFTTNATTATGLLKTGVASPAQEKLDSAVLAAMTNVASMLLCLDETITKE